MNTWEIKYAPTENRDVAPESYEIAHINFGRDKWYPWKYNEIIGYLNLYFFGSQLRGKISLIDNRRINRGIIKKKFKILYKGFETNMPRNLSSDEVFTFILDCVKDYNRKEFPRRYFDLQCFEAIGKFVDWNALVSVVNAFPH